MAVGDAESETSVPAHWYNTALDLEFKRDEITFKYLTFSEGFERHSFFKQSKRTSWKESPIDVIESMIERKYLIALC